MIFTFAPRYLTPKWQARVTPKESAFYFNNGVKVSNLWELKQALRIIRDDVITDHMNSKKNDIATWIENAVGDKTLASLLKKNSTRWGAIVALERHLMRTVNLPFYVADRWLKKTNLPFYFIDGSQVDSLEKLKHAFDKVTDETIAFHLEREPNDIAKWVNDVIGDYLLSEILAENINRQQMHICISDHLIMLHDAQRCR